MSQMKLAPPAKKAPPSSTIKRHVSAVAKHRSSAELIEAVRDGLSFAELERLRSDLDVPLDTLASYLGIARATLHRRKAAGVLTSAESEKVVRFGRLLRQAVETIGSVEDARSWLGASQVGLAGAVPLDYARTELGVREVEDLLGRIEHGVYA